MASTTSKYDKLHKYLIDGTVDLDTNTIKVALVSSAYTFNAAHNVWADVSANEVASGAGYTTGGIALASKVVSYAGPLGKFLADNPVWTGLTKTFRYAVIYASGTLNGVVDPLLLCILLDNTPADIAAVGVDYSIQWNAGGILTLGN